MLFTVWCNECMEELKHYLRSLADEELRRAFALRCGTSLGHMRNVIYGKPCSPELAAAIDVQSSGVVRRWHMRPVDWHRIWPELIGLDGAPPAAELVTTPGALEDAKLDPAAGAGTPNTETQPHAA